jgi:hypothetical protein
MTAGTAVWPNSPSTEEIVELLYGALAEPVGVLLQCNDPVRARAKIYAVRRGLMDAELNALRFVVWPEGQLAICKGELVAGVEMEPRGAVPAKGKLALKDLGFD